MATWQQVVAINFEHPTWTDKEIAHALDCDAGYVRSTAQRRGLNLGRVYQGQKRVVIDAALVEPLRLPGEIPSATVKRIIQEARKWQTTGQ